MQPNELINTPGDLLILALGVGIAGALAFGLANLIMKLFGDDIQTHARESEKYRYMGYSESMHAFYSNPRNIPVAIGMVGIFMLFAAICMVIGAAGWFILMYFHVKT